MVSASVAWAVDVATVQELIDAVASANTEIKLTADLALTNTLEINRTTQLTIDLNGHNITADGCRAIHIKQGVVTIKSDTPAMISAEGSVPLDNSVIRLGDGATAIQGTKNTVNMTLDENVTVQTTVETCYGITVFGGSTTETLTVNGKVRTTGRSAVAGNGNAWNDGTTIIIGEKAEITTTNDVAIYQPQDGTLTVSGKVTGAGGIEIKAGQLIVNQTANISVLGGFAPTHPAPNNNGTSTRGYAIAIVENGAYAGVSSINVSKDATITGPIAMVKDSENATTESATFDPSGMQMLVKVTDSTGKLVGQYQSLELAMANAPAGATITLLGDVEIASTIETSKDYTLDLNGKTLTSDGQRALWVKSGEVIVKSNTEGGKITVPTITDNDKSVIRVGSDESAAVSLVVERGVTISADECYGITVFGHNGTETLTVKGIVATKIRPAIAGNGTVGLASTTINITSTAKITTTDEVAIYHPQAGTITVDGTVKGAGGIEIKGGSLVVGSAAHIIATGSPSHVVNNDGTSTRGYSVAIVESNAGYGNGAGVSAVNIDNGATLEGPVAELQDTPLVGFNPTYTGNAVTKKVAAIGSDEYFTLKDAINIVPAQGSVRLLDNLSTTTLVMDVVKTYTLDLNGKTLTGNACAALQITHGHVTLDGAADSKVTVSGTPAPQAAILLGGNDGSSRSVSLTINKDVTVDGSTLASGIMLAGDMTRETLVVNGTVKADGHNAILGSKDPNHGGTSITIARTLDQNGDLVSEGKVEATNAVAIYHPQSGELIVEGTVEGKGTTAGAIEMKGGDLTVMEGATVKAVGETTHSKNNDAPSTNGYAIALVENPAFTGVGRVNISDRANVTGVIACLIDEQNNNVAEPLFTGDVYMIAETNINNGRGDKYAKLNDAITAAPASTAEKESVVKLLDNLTVTTEPVAIVKAITLDMDDYSIINNQTTEGAVAMTISANATIKNGGIVSGKTGTPATELNNAGISVTGRTVALQNMTVSTKGVALSVSGGTVSADQKSSFSSNSNNTVALSGGTLTMNGKVLNTSSTSPAVAGTETGVLTVAATATVSSATSNAINWGSTGKLTISGGKIAGTEAVHAEKGYLTISGGTLTGTGNAVNIASADCTPSITGGTFYCGESGSPIAAVTGKEHFVSGTNTYFSVAINPVYCELGYMVSPSPKNNGLFYLIDEIVIYDGVDWSSPSVSRINKAKYIRNSGMGAAGTKFGTLCLPFSFNPGASGTTIPTGMKFYEVTSINSAKSEITITELNGEIAAGTPVVFQFESAASEFTIESTDADIVAGDPIPDNNLVGTFTKTTLTTSTSPSVSSVYYLNSDAFHQAKSSLTVPAFRAYIKFGSSNPVKSEVLYIHTSDEETDAIGCVLDDGEMEAVYDLQGRKQNGLQKGMNIMKMANGRTIKVMVR